MSQGQGDNQPRGTPPDEPDDDEGALASRRYSMAEAADVLGIHTVSLERWLGSTDQDILPEQDRSDRRYKWLTRAQVAELARRHRRELRPSAQYDHVMARLRDLERRIDDLESWRAELAHLQGAPPAAPSYTPPAEPFEPFVPRKREASRTRPIGKVALLDLLPEGWVPCRRWGREHGVEYWDIDRAIHGRRDEHGNIVTPPVLAFHRDVWKSRDRRPVRVTEAFDPEQQEAARLHFGK